MAVLVIKCELLKDPRMFEFMRDGQTNTGANMWVQDLDGKLKMPIVWFNPEEEPVVGDQYKFRCNVGRRKDNRTEQWDYSFVVDQVERIDSHRKAKQNAYVEDEDDGIDFPFGK
jgi:hypothetical protein